MKNRKKLSIILVFALALSILPAMPVSAKVKISATKKTLYVGKSTTLKVTGTKKKAKWSSSNKKVATVTQKGKVTAKKKGTVTIKAKVAKSTFKCKVTVKDVHNTQSTPTQTPVKKDETVTVNKLLCEDENISVVLKEIKNGKIYFLYRNNADEDIRVDVMYIELNGVGYYQEIEGNVVISGKTRIVELKIYDSDIEEIDYVFQNGVISGKFEYFSEDEEIKYYDTLKFEDIRIG